MATPDPRPFVKSPPTGWVDSLRSIGPGVIVVGMIVGSGELVTTTLLGAKVGFVVLWLIVVSCLVKVIIQEQWAYYVITSGGTLLDATSFLPGPRVRGLSLWTWLLFLYFILCILPTAGVVGMTATMAVLATGVGSVPFWALALTALTILFLWFGTYARIEKLFILMVSLFSLSMCIALALTQSTQLAIRWSELISGLRFELPPAGMYIALSAFGITGIAAPEIIFYTYWCLEKGYGRYIGPPEETPEWRGARAGLDCCHAERHHGLCCHLHSDHDCVLSTRGSHFAPHPTRCSEPGRPGRCFGPLEDFHGVLRAVEFSDLHDWRFLGPVLYLCRRLRVLGALQCRLL